MIAAINQGLISCMWRRDCDAFWSPKSGLGRPWLFLRRIGFVAHGPVPCSSQVSAKRGFVHRFSLSFFDQSVSAAWLRIWASLLFQSLALALLLAHLCGRGLHGASGLRVVSWRAFWHECSPCRTRHDRDFTVFAAVNVAVVAIRVSALRPESGVARCCLPRR